MDMPKTAWVSVIAMLAVVVVLALADMNFVGWLGAMVVEEAPGTWLVGALVALGAGFGFSALWSGAVSRQQQIRKNPPIITGPIYGLAVGMLFVFVVPPILYAVMGDPVLFHDNPFAGLGTALGGHAVPALPDFGFEPPLHDLTDDEWIAKGAWQDRIVMFSIAFAAYGLILGLFTGEGRSK